MWLACLLLAAALFFFLLLKEDRRKGEYFPVPVSQGEPQTVAQGSIGWRKGRSRLTLTGSATPVAAAPRTRTALLLHSADGAYYERLVGALASALSQMPLRVAVDLWSRRELSAHGALAWFHQQRRRTLQEDGVVILLFSPAAVAQCQQWLQLQTVEPGPHDALAAWLSCVLPDFLQGQATGRYVGVYFDGLLHPDTVPAPFRVAPLFSLPSQLPAFLDVLQGSSSGSPRRPADMAERVAQALLSALDSCT